MFSEQTPFDTRVNRNEFDYLCTSNSAQSALAEQYVGLPFDA
jgi:p-hydroxybenzoate 3-monooxygenase